MEQKINLPGKERTLSELSSFFRELYQLPETDVCSYSPLTLAYLGDAVFEVIVRTVVVAQGNAPVDRMHKTASHIVNAASQSDLVRLIEKELTEEEEAVYRRGRNAHSYTKAKHAAVSDYRRATGLEALIGWLFLMGRYERLLTLVREGLAELGYL